MPDSAFCGTIGWPDLHKAEAAQAFGRALGSDDRSQQMIAGILDHIELDNRSHHGFEGGDGYAFSHQTPALVRLAARACQVQDDQMARGLAHNFIESGVDINLLSREQGFQASMRRALGTVDLDPLANEMARHWKKDQVSTRDNLRAFMSLVTDNDLSRIDDWAELWMKLTELLLHHKGDLEAARQAVTLATKVTADDYPQVLR